MARPQIEKNGRFSCTGNSTHWVSWPEGGFNFNWSIRNPRVAERIFSTLFRRVLGHRVAIVIPPNSEAGWMIVWRWAASSDRQYYFGLAAIGARQLSRRS